MGKSRGGWNTKIHLVAADERTAVTPYQVRGRLFALSPGEAHDGPEGRRLLESLGPPEPGTKLLMDRAYEGNPTRGLANEVERLFRRLKGFRRIFTRYDKLDAIFSGFILFALIYDALL